MNPGSGKVKEGNMYLYYYPKFKQEVDRFLVTRETNAFYFCKLNDTAELKVPKKTLRVGQKWDVEQYFIETEALQKEFVNKVLKKGFQRKLAELMNCNDLEKIKAYALAIKRAEEE
jgi:hypothetical protein